MRKLLFATAALASMSGVALADSTDMVLGSAAPNATPLSAQEMSAVTGTFFDTVTLSQTAAALNILSNRSTAFVVQRAEVEIRN